MATPQEKLDPLASLFDPAPAPPASTTAGILPRTRPVPSASSAGGVSPRRPPAAISPRVPPSATVQEPAPSSNPYGAFDAQTEGRWSITDAPKVKGWFQQTFNRNLPVTAEGQSSTHNVMGLDHSDSLDVGVNPTSEEGKALREYLRAQGIPFLAYDRAVPGAATAAHIHVGFPSHGGEAGEAARAGSITDLFDSGPDPLASLFDPASDDDGEVVRTEATVERTTGKPLALDDARRAVPVDAATAPQLPDTRPAPLPAPVTFDVRTQEGRQARADYHATEQDPRAFVEVSVPLGGVDPSKQSGNDTMRRAIAAWAQGHGITAGFANRWMDEHVPNGYSLHSHDTGAELATAADAISPDAFDSENDSLRVKLPVAHLKQIEQAWLAQRGTADKLVDWAASNEESPGEKALDVAGPVTGAVAKGASYIARPFTATSAGVFAGLRGENPFREAFHTFTTGEHTDKGSNPLGNFLRDNRTLAAINPRLGRLLGGAADVVFDPANLIGLGIAGKGARALAGAGRLGRVAEEVGAVGKSLGLLERGIVDARPLGLGEAVADVSSTAAKGGEAASLEGAAQSATREGATYSHTTPEGRTHEGTLEPLSEKDTARLIAAGSDPAKFVRLRTPEGGYVVAERGALAVPYDVEMRTADGARLLHSTATGETRNAATGEAVPLDEGPSPAVRGEMARYSRERADFHAREAATASDPNARANAQGLADEYGAEAARLEAGDAPAPEGSASGITPRSTVQPRSLLRRAARTAVDLVQLPKTKAGWDLSATGRQALPQIMAHPSYFKDAMVAQTKAFARGSSFNEFVAAIKGRPDFDLMKDSGLYLSSAGSGPEEAFASGLVKRISGVKGSERAFSAALDSVRVQAWDNYVGAVADNPHVTPETYKAIADLVNISTGRGVVPILDRSALGKQIVNALNVPLFSPRNMAGKFNLISPARLIRNAVDPATRPVAWLQARDATRGFATLGTTLGLMHVAGLDAGVNPFSDDFGKLRVGNAVYDLTGGEGMSVRYLAKMARSFREIEQGKPLKRGQTPLDLTTHYLRSQLQPAAAAGVDLATGKNFAGQPVTGADVAADLVVPFVVDDLYRGWVDAGGSSLSDVYAGKNFKPGIGGAARGLPGVLGAGVAFYPKKDGASSSGTFPRDQSSTPDAAPAAESVVQSNEMRLEGQRESGNVIDARDADMEAERARAGLPPITDEDEKRVVRLLQHRLDVPQFAAFAKSLDESVKMGVVGEGADAVAEYVSKALAAAGASKFADSSELAHVMRLLARERRLRPLQFAGDVADGRYGARLMDSILDDTQYPQNSFPHGSAGRSSEPRGITSDASASDAPAATDGDRAAHLADVRGRVAARVERESAEAARRAGVPVRTRIPEGAARKMGDGEGVEWPEFENILRGLGVEVVP
jgi:hypothetical protein